MKEWYEECMDTLLKDEKNRDKLRGQPMIAEMPHGHFKGTINDYAGTIKASCVQYNTIVLEPIKDKKC